MTTYRELLERCAPYIDGRVTAFSHETDREALNRTRSELLRDIDAYLAQPMTTGLTEEEQKRARWHRQDEEHPELCHSNCGEGWPCFIASTLRSLAESRAREGELVAALEQVAVIMAYRSCTRRGPGGHYNSVRCFDQGTPGHGSDEYGDSPLSEEKWCDGCVAFQALTKARALAQGKKE
jgi:hypothetical protein